MTSNEYWGKQEYLEEHPLLWVRLQLFMISAGSTFLSLLIIYAGFRHSLFMGIFALLLFGWLLYPTICGIITSIFGIRNAKIFPRGFISPYMPPRILLRHKKGFIPWEEVVDIVANRYLRATGVFPYIVVELKRGIFAIPTKYLKNPEFFICHAENYTGVVKDRETKIGLFHIVHFLPPPQSADIKEDGIVLHYPEKEKRIEFAELKKIKPKGKYQFLTKNGRKMGVLGLTDRDLMDIREAFKIYLERGSTTQRKIHGEKAD